MQSFSIFSRVEYGSILSDMLKMSTKIIVFTRDLPLPNNSVVQILYRSDIKVLLTFFFFQFFRLIAYILDNLTRKIKIKKNCIAHCVQNVWNTCDELTKTLFTDVERKVGYSDKCA